MVRVLRNSCWALLAVALAFGCDDVEETGPDFQVFGGRGGSGGAGGGTAGTGGGAGGSGGTGGGVVPDNARPQLRRIGDRNAPVGELLEIQLTAEDPDGDPLTYNVRSALPDGAKFEKGPGLFTWTPTDAQLRVVALITFEVSDGRLKDQETIQVSVVPGGQGNQAPVIEAIGDAELVAGEAFVLEVVATDVDGDLLSYSMQGDALDGALLDGDDGTFTWTPPAAAAGNSYNVTFSVTDGTAEASTDAKLVVRAPGDPGDNNLPPRIIPIADQSVTVGQPYQLVIRAEDEAPDALQFSVAGALPPGASFDGPSATFVWTPQADQVNQAFPVVFQVSDGEFRAVERVNFQVLAGDVQQDCVPDAEEDGGEPLRLVSGAVLNDRTICPRGDRDTFTFDLAEGEGFELTVTFDTTICDLDLVVNNAAGDAVAASAGLTNTESVSRDGLPAGRYEARLHGVACESPDYDLTFNVLAEPGCQDDAFEAGAGNDDAEHASLLTDAVGPALHVCPGDLDYYAVDLQEGEDVTIVARFAHAMGDIDLLLTGPGNFRASALSVDDDETIQVPSVPATGRYVLEVGGYEEAANDYRLELVREAPQACEADRLEPDDNRRSATRLQPELYRNLTWCGEDDWHRVQVAAGDLLQVYLTFDEAPPAVEATDSEGQALDGFAYRPASGAGCSAGRDGCWLLEGVLDQAIEVYFLVNQGVRGQGYDLRIRVTGDGACSEDVVRCGVFEVCDYDDGLCAEGLCGDAGDCPAGFECHQEWCVEACENNIDCLHPDHVCKTIEGAGRCGMPGGGRVGARCLDFSDCAGTLECLDGAFVPGGYCTQVCGNDAECGEGSCATFEDGNYCGRTCQGAEDCREGYSCTQRDHVGGPGTVRVCTPGG
jgi:hypothetical protein